MKEKMATANAMSFNLKLADNEHDCTKDKLEMWANAQRDGRPAYCRWRPLFNAAKFG